MSWYRCNRATSLVNRCSWALFTRGSFKQRYQVLHDAIGDGFGDLVLTQVGANTVIRFANVLITIENERVEDFSAGDFLF